MRQASPAKDRLRATRATGAITDDAPVLGPVVAGIAMGLALLVGVLAVTVAIRHENFYWRLCSISVAGWSYLAYIWLCCVIVRHRSYHAAWGLFGATIIGGALIPFLPADSDDDILGERRRFQWIGARHLLALLIAYGLVLAAFWNSFQSGWVLDNLYIIKLDKRTAAQTWDFIGFPDELGFSSYFTQDYWWPKGISGLYRPLTSITYWFNWNILGKPEVTTSFHVVNLILHWINAALVYALAWVLIGRWGPAMLAMLVFAVHPITVESVTNIIGRADQFAALAVLGGVLLWDRGSQREGWGRLPWFFAVMLVVAFGVFSKESAVAIGLVLLVYDVVYRWNPTIAKWFGVILLVMLVPAISGASFAIEDFREPLLTIASIWKQLIAAAIIVVGLGLHIALSGVPGPLRLISLTISVLVAVAASFFHPYAGVALIALLVVYEYLFGPWLAKQFPEFHRIRIPALLYTLGFCAVVFAPLAIGGLLWLNAGAAAKHGVVGTINVLNDTWPLDVRRVEMIGWDVRLPMASMLVLMGLCGWLYFTLRSPSERLAMLVAVAIFPLLGALLLKADTMNLLTAGTVGLLLFTFLGLMQPRDRGPAPILAVPIVLAASIAASLYIFYAGFVLTFTVGSIELIRRNTMPAVLRESTVWRNLLQRFVVGYFWLLPPVIAMVFVRYWIFNIQSTPPETPYLDNPLRGGPFDPLSFWQSRLTAVHVIGKLMYLLVWPRYLSSDYSHDQIPFFTWNLLDIQNLKTIFTLGLLIGLIVLAIVNFRRNKPLSFFIMFFFAALLPTSNLITLIGSIMAERFMYLPLIGFAACAAILLMRGYDALVQSMKRFELPALPLRAGLTAAAALVLGLLAYRSYIRNFDWESDITLWESARKISPNSFRCYQSLAFAYFEQDAEKNIDKMILIAEQARPIVDKLPNDRNSSRLYLHLGMYYTQKGDLVAPRDQHGNAFLTSEAGRWYEKAIEVLDKGVEIDRTFNEINRRRQIARGDPPETVYDAGLTPIYTALGIANAKLGRHRQAINAFQYFRQLDPDSIEPYYRIALSHLDQNKPDHAAVSLIQMLVLPSASPTAAWREEVWQLLAQVYASSPDGRGAIIAGQDGVRLNLGHPVVRNHMIDAYRGLIRIYRQCNRPRHAELMRQQAVYQHGLPPSLFDSVMVESVDIVTPDGLFPAPPRSARSQR